MPPRHSARLFGALAVGWAAAVAVAFTIGCGYAFVMGNDSAHPFEGPPLGLVLGLGGIAALMAIPFAFMIGLVVAFPLFWYWTWRPPLSLARHMAAGILLSVAGVLLVAVFNRATDLVGSDFRFALVIAAVAGPVSALAVWFVAQRQYGGVI